MLAAMYMLRMISAVLHQDVGPAVPDAALDLRPAELAVVVPLVGVLLGLSAWPAAISQRSFPANQATATIEGVLAPAGAPTPPANVRIEISTAEPAP